MEGRAYVNSVELVKEQAVRKKSYCGHGMETVVMRDAKEGVCVLWG